MAESQKPLCLHIPVTRLTAIWLSKKPLHNAPRKMRTRRHGRMATGGKDERLREHRIGHFRFQACGGCVCDGRVVFGAGFIPIRRDGYRRNGGQADLEG
jgi:hypothetical protein